MTRPKPPTRRCAVYTRKSSEEGLEQEFNSLHAQREACEAFIRSQAGEGWKLIKTPYDDGGLSGGTMERPGLQRLMTDIRAGLVDTVVVYKVDRLTRSLADFAKLVELFDGQGVTFVAVTQQFNTTTSMGRLTLNILLSFAQFEREVTGERIRDKVAASKRKGMWMGGNPPLGYDVVEKKLVVNPREARTVRHIFDRYFATGSVRELKEELDRDGITSKRRVSVAGNVSGGGSFARGAIYALLSNPTYIGEVPHKQARFPGQHEAIVDRETWDRVQRELKDKGPERRRKSAAAPSPLAGKLFDGEGERLVPTHAAKKGTRYRYYISQSLLAKTSEQSAAGWRVPAKVLENAVVAGVLQMLGDQTALLDAASDAELQPEHVSELLANAARLQLEIGSAGDRVRVAAHMLERVELREDQIVLALETTGFLPEAGSNRKIVLVIPVTIQRRRQEMRIVVNATAQADGRQDQTLLKTIARARGWSQELFSGATSLGEIAIREGRTKGYISQRLPLAFLGPEILEMLIRGDQASGLTADALVKRADISVSWEKQKRVFSCA